MRVTTAVALHLTLRQARAARWRRTVMDQHLGLVDRSGCRVLKVTSDGEIAVRGRLAVEIQHVLRRRIDLLLDRRCDRVSETVLGGSAGILGWCTTTTVGGYHYAIYSDTRKRGVGDTSPNAIHAAHDRQHHRQ